MKRFATQFLGGSALVVALLAMVALFRPAFAGDEVTKGYDFQLPSSKLKLPFAKEEPIVFVSSQNFAEWQALQGYWNRGTEMTIDPSTGLKVERKVVKIKVPLGLSQGPKAPLENQPTVAKWKLGRDLYFDGVLSSDGSVSCSSCHHPARGFTDQSPVSTGINGNKGGVSAPTVMNSGFSPLQFWDGRAQSLEDQAQGPPTNPLEMFDGKGVAWHEAIKRIRARGDYTQRFQGAFGHEPTRDAVAMAIATYERTVLNGNSIHDRAELAMRFRVAEEGGVGAKLEPQDYQKALDDAAKKKDKSALEALQINDPATIPAVAKQIAQGRDLFFGKARCTLCHTGDTFTDGQFHNLGVGAKDGKLDGVARYGALPTGHKNPEAMGAFKTPTVRGILSTAPYLHDGSEDTLEKLVDFYDRGGNANEFLDPKMRDVESERAYFAAKSNGTTYNGPQPKLFGADQKPIIPFQLKLSTDEKRSLVLFMRALQGEVDPMVTDPKASLPN